MSAEHIIARKFRVLADEERILPEHRELCREWYAFGWNAAIVYTEFNQQQPAQPTPVDVTAVVRKLKYAVLARCQSEWLEGWLLSGTRNGKRVLEILEQEIQQLEAGGGSTTPDFAGVVRLLESTEEENWTCAAIQSDWPRDEQSWREGYAIAVAQVERMGVRSVKP